MHAKGIIVDSMFFLLVSIGLVIGFMHFGSYAFTMPMANLLAGVCFLSAEEVEWAKKAPMKSLMFIVLFFWPIFVLLRIYYKITGRIE